MGQPSSNPVRQQDSSSSVNSRQSKYQAPRISESAQNKPAPRTAFSQMGQQSSYRPPNPTHQYSQQPRPPPAPAPAPPPSRPSARAAQPQNNSWKFTNSFGPQRSTFEGNRSTNRPQAVRQTQVDVKSVYTKTSKSAWMFHDIVVITAAFVFVLSRAHLQWSQPLRTHCGSWLQLLTAWDTGASLKTKSRTYLRYLVSWLGVVSDVYGIFKHH